MVMLQALPAVPGLKETLEYTKDYLATLVILFAIGLFAMGIIVYLLWQFTPDIKSFLSIPQQNYNLITIHHRDTAAAIAKIAAIEQSVQAFRDSEKDLLANIREAVSLHATKCEAGQVKIAEVTGVASGHGKLLEKTIQQLEVNATAMAQILKDNDSIGKGVDRLVTILTIARRDEDDRNRA